jgi:hypothetical protein
MALLGLTIVNIMIPNVITRLHAGPGICGATGWGRPDRRANAMAARPT